MKPIPSLDVQLADQTAEQSRRNHDDRIKQIAARPAMALTSLGAITIADGGQTTVAHKLDREPTHVFLSPRGGVTPGLVEEVRGGSNRSKVLVIKATGWGGPLTVDVSVM